jgi:hypothetical protein
MNVLVTPIATALTAKPAQSWHAGEYDLLLDAGAALARAQEHADRLTDALRYFVELAADGHQKEPGEVQQKLAAAVALIQLSDPISLKVRELAFKCAVLAPEQAAAVETSAPSPIERSAAPLVGDVFAPEQASVVATPSAGAVLVLEEASALEVSAARSIDRSSAPFTADAPEKKQSEQRRIDTVLSEIETLLGTASVNEQTPMAVYPDLTEQIRKEREEKHKAAPVTASQSDPERTVIRPDRLKLDLNERKAPDPVTHELEALLGKDAMSVFSEAETFLANSIALEIKRDS